MTAVWFLLSIFSVVALHVTGKEDYDSRFYGEEETWAISRGFYYAKCKYYECCRSPWINLNAAEDLHRRLTYKLYGQPLVIETIVGAVKGHLTTAEPVKPLVLSLHGPTGVGKNYVTRMIAESIFEKGTRSGYFHLFQPLLHFYDPNDVYLYKTQLHEWIRGNVTKCGRSIFVFDEMDRLMPDLIEAIVPYVDHHGRVDGVDYRLAIFIFISNTGSAQIIRRFKDLYAEKYQAREGMRLEDFEVLLKESAYADDGGLKMSPIVKKHLIDNFVPFLPLQEYQVKRCIIDEFSRRSQGKKPSEDFVKAVENGVEFSGVLATHGCKVVAAKVSLELGKLREKERQIFSEEKRQLNHDGQAKNEL